MLNTNNYFSKAASINWDNLPEALAKGHKLVEGGIIGQIDPFLSASN